MLAPHGNHTICHTIYPNFRKWFSAISLWQNSLFLHYDIGKRGSVLKKMSQRLSVAQTIRIAGVILVAALWVFPWPALASSCVDCHTSETSLKSNLSPVETKKSALTAGAG